jgi:hypothetical protein
MWRLDMIAHETRWFRAAALAAAIAVASSVAALAVDKDKAMYMGGTLTDIEEKAEGTVNTRSDAGFAFDARKKGSVAIPYASITELEYGQKAGRRVAVGILISPWALFSKKRNHYLTISYMDQAGKEQAAVFELGKEIVRTTLKILEVRTGKEIGFQDAEACKQYKTPKECEGK